MSRSGRFRVEDLTEALRAMETRSSTPEDLRHLLHELHRHVLELETRNRELQEAHQARDEFRDRELRELQVRLSFAERLATVGTRTAAIAHELNNPLAFLMGNLTVVTRILREQAHGAREPLSDPSTSPELALQALADAQVGAERIQEIVKQLSTLARPPPGSAFSLRPPPLAVPSRVAASPRPASATPEQTESARRGRILIVDDELRLGQTLQLLLGRAHDVAYTPSAREALSWIQTGKRYDAILCDLMMAEVTGKQFYDALCQHSPEYAHRVIFMTGGAYTPASVDFVAKMSNPILTKPFRPEELEKLLIALVPSV